MSTIPCTNPAHGVKSHVADSIVALECLMSSSQTPISRLVVPGLTSVVKGAHFGRISKMDTTTAKDLDISRSEVRVALGVEDEQEPLTELNEVRFDPTSTDVSEARRVSDVANWKKLKWNHQQGYTTVALFVDPRHDDDGELVGFGTWNETECKYEVDYRIALGMFDQESRQRILESMEVKPRDRA